MKPWLIVRTAAKVVTESFQNLCAVVRESMQFMRHTLMCARDDQFMIRNDITALYLKCQNCGHVSPGVDLR